MGSAFLTALIALLAASLAGFIVGGFYGTSADGYHEAGMMMAVSRIGSEDFHRENLQRVDQLRSRRNACRLVGLIVGIIAFAVILAFGWSLPFIH